MGKYPQLSPPRGPSSDEIRSRFDISSQFDAVAEYRDGLFSVSLKRVAVLKGGAGFPPDLQGQQGNDLPFYKVGDLAKAANGRDLDGAAHTISRKQAEELGARVFPANSLVWAKIGAALSLNRRRILPTDSCIDNNMTGCVVDSKYLDVGYAFLLLSSMDFGVHAKPGAVPSFSEGDQGDLVIPQPPLPEQYLLSAKITCETSRIDTLIAKKTEFIKLLAKKRQALITHAVTKGLNPMAKMKDSGVEWLGKVPEHWQVRPIKSLATGPATLFIDGDWIESKNLADSGIRYITTGNVGEGEYKEQGSGFISEETFDELRCTEVLPGDVLISRLNPPIGRACIAPNLRSRVVTSVDNVILRPSAEFDSMFIVFRFSAKDYFHEMSILGSGATMQRVSRTELGNVRVAWPPLNEQIEISRHIQAETMQIDTLSERVGKSIDLLKKRRSALITAAVTGKIDLRESA